MHLLRLIIFLEMFAQTSCIHNTWNNLKGASLRPYKLEIIFSLSFFDPMEHLLIHLEYEANAIQMDVSFSEARNNIHHKYVKYSFLF